MTTPGGVPNLPQGALTIDNLESKTQDMSTPAMRARAAERFPNIFNSSTGGNALNDLTPIGIITQIFSGFNSVVANADPADVQGPEDLPGLLLDFIESLPVVGELIGLLEAILGTYSGDDPVLLEVQTIFAPIRAIVDSLTGLAGGLGGLGSFFPDLLGLFGNPTGLGTGSPTLPGLGSIPILGPVLNLFGGATTGTQATNFFTNLLSLLGGPTLTGSTGSFNPVTAAEDFITNVLNPTGLLASISAIVQALTGVSGGSLNILGPLTGLFGPFLDLLDGTGSITGAGNFTDNGDGTGFFDLGGLGSLVDNGDGTAMSVSGILENLTGLLGTFQSTADRQQNIIDAIFNALNFTNITGNFHDDVLQSALQNIPFLNILGIGGPADIGGSIQSTWDNLISGLVGSVGSGAGLSDLFNIAQGVSSNATKGGFSWDILGIRNNRSLDSGMLATSKSNVPLSRVALQSSAPTFGVTQAATTIAWDVVEQDQQIGVVRWHGSGNASLTDFYVNVWKMDRSTGTATLVHRSASIIGDIPATATNPPIISYSIPTPIAALATEVYGFELEPKGAGTHNVVGSATWMPNDTATFPRNFAATRNAGTGTPPSSIAGGSVTYSGNVPFVEYGVSLGTASTFHDPQIFPFFTATATTMPIPSWCNHLDIVAVGGGGGGHQGGTWGIGGEGGDAGVFTTTTWDRGTHFTGGTISITVGAGGSAGFGGNGGVGGASSVSIAGFTVTAVGGAGANSFDVVGSNHAGAGPGSITYNSQPYVGGGTQNSYGARGAAPGGAGAGGNWVSFQPGGAGAAGAVWVRAYQ